ncbi:hypothetical protein SSX86_032834, partial [Deinandra increscens subsp. villosa]
CRHKIYLLKCHTSQSRKLDKGISALRCILATIPSIVSSVDDTEVYNIGNQELPSKIDSVITLMTYIADHGPSLSIIFIDFCNFWRLKMAETADLGNFAKLSVVEKTDELKKDQKNEQLEREELEKAPKFKARPLNKKIFESKGELGIPFLFLRRSSRGVTKPKLPRLNVSERTERRKMVVAAATSSAASNMR